MKGLHDFKEGIISWKKPMHSIEQLKENFLSVIEFCKYLERGIDSDEEETDLFAVWSLEKLTRLSRLKNRLTSMIMKMPSSHPR